MAASRAGGARGVNVPVRLTTALAGVLILAATATAAQGVPGAPKGDWLAYSLNTLPADNLRRCGVSPAVYAEWLKVVEAAAAVISTSPGFADLTGYVPMLVAGGNDYAEPAGTSDCKKGALGGYVAFWPWLLKHVDPIPAAAGGPKFRLKSQWVNNTFGGLWIELNVVPHFDGSPWEKDERGVFFEQPEVEIRVGGFPMYREWVYITRPDNPLMVVPVDQERVVNAFLVLARRDAALVDGTLASRRQAYERFMSPASLEARTQEIERAAASQRNPASSEQARKQATTIDRRREDDYRKAANPAPDDPVFAPVKRLKEAEALLAGMSEAERRAPAWRTWNPRGSNTLDLMPADSPDARAVVEVNPAFFDFSKSRAALRNVVIRVGPASRLTKTLDTSDLDQMEKINRAVMLQTDWTRIVQLMK